MDQDKIEFKVVLRSPKYPVIIISDNILFPATNINQLAMNCVPLLSSKDQNTVDVVDSTGAVFWYFPERYFLSPGFAPKKWTKKRIIELYNNSLNAKENNKQYSMKSLANKKLSKIVVDICELLRLNKRLDEMR